MNFGLSPGAVQGERMKRLWTWVMERTVAPTTQGRPRTEWTNIMIPTISRSRWYPEPFCSEGEREGRRVGGGGSKVVLSYVIPPTLP